VPVLIQSWDDWWEEEWAGECWVEELEMEWVVGREEEWVVGREEKWVVGREDWWGVGQEWMDRSTRRQPTGEAS
jgi:hypothetical protein